MQEFEEDFYAILGVEDSAKPEEIRKAYLALARKLHPDRFPNDAAQRAIAQSQFVKVTRAHDVIGHAESRTEYDALRELSKKRGGGAVATPEPIAAQAPQSVATPATDWSDRPMTRKEQQTTVSDEENINVKWANKHLARADDLFKNKRYQEAETAMKEAIRLVPADPKYRNKLAEIYLARGWKTLAKTEVEAALRIDPKDAEARMLEVKIKQAMKSQTQTQQSKSKANLVDQIKNLFNGKKR
ncbi:MAG TPA: DnaJ domain-containing protein [Planktothrix sp.]|jgi:curved DNA-binding protein CbpA